MKYIKWLLIGIAFINICVLGLNSSLCVAKHKEGWTMNKKGRVFYYDENGEKVKNGKIQIGKKFYCFDENGMQRVGWVKCKNRYCYFKIGPKKKGYLVCNKTINGIKINAKGYAVDNKDKARLLTEANNIVFSITNFKMSKKEKYKECFLYIRDKIEWRNLTGFKSDLDKWDQYYASYAIYKGYGDCYTGGCGFAYLAAAAGAKKVYAVSSGGHGWAEIDGRYYDPNWSWVSKDVDKYFAVTKDQSGRGGRPSYASHRAYVKRVD